MLRSVSFAPWWTQLSGRFLQERDETYRRLYTLELPNLIRGGNLFAVQALWIDHKLTNFEYLTQLNKMAGRSFNDLMQYPVFPFVLSSYTSETLDLNDSSVYRYSCSKDTFARCSFSCQSCSNFSARFHAVCKHISPAGESSQNHCLLQSLCVMEGSCHTSHMHDSCSVSQEPVPPHLSAVRRLGAPLRREVRILPRAEAEERRAAAARRGAGDAAGGGAARAAPLRLALLQLRHRALLPHPPSALHQHVHALSR